MATGDLIYGSWSSLETYMSADLNSLANDTTNIGVVLIDNTTTKYHNIAAELYLGTVDLSAAAGLTVELYLVPSIDETNYADDGADASTTDLPPGSAHVGTFYIQKTSAVHRAAIVCRECLQALKYTPVLINKTGAAFNASGNVLKVKMNSDQVAQ